MRTSPAATFEHGKPHDLSDGSSGVQMAKAGEMAALGVARLNDQALLNEAGAGLVVTSLDDVAVNTLSEGLLDQTTIRLWAGGHGIRWTRLAKGGKQL
jgi:hypothetical protein